MQSQPITNKVNLLDTETIRNTLQRGSTILLMGPTGSGKSAFVNLLTKDEHATTGHDLKYEVKASTYVDPQTGISVRLIDTPAFDDERTKATDTDVLETIARFLQEDDTNVNGILYFHRISEARMGGPVKKNLKIFKEICGEKNFNHVRVITTYWNLIDEKEGKGRESTLANGPFKALVKGGAKFVRHDQSVDSARSIINDFIHHSAFKLKIQEELDAAWALGLTSAGRVLMDEIEAIQKKSEKETEAVRKEMTDAVYRGDDEKLMEQERQKREEEVERILEERRKLETIRIVKGGKSPAKEKEKDKAKDESRKKDAESRKADRQVKREGKQKEKQPEDRSVPFPGRDKKGRRQPQASEEQGGILVVRREVSSLLYDMVDVIRHCSKAGADQFGRLGKLFGALVGLAVVNGVALGVVVGLWFSLFAATKRVVVGGSK
ncbi:hypothetical protein CVT26_004816 [Gymnopilus dilepis]|uniref:AIG1-type G domain-containing protein n=1 Tax=Gymnopilus dilepis TaxID=231916 RepID=A0A409XZI3_9AGAR|nr:hypothetical protein CVT26_004816 [Gymnopilus dilepis]